jgi:hypothetical protein
MTWNRMNERVDSFNIGTDDLEALVRDPPEPFSPERSDEYERSSRGYGGSSTSARRTQSRP